MTTAREHDDGSAGAAREPAVSGATGSGGTVSRQEPITAHLTSDEVWHALAGASFAVVSYVTPAGEPRSSGVVYATAGRRLYVAVAADGWKARHIAASGRVAVTVPVRRGGVLSLLFPIPPATVSFHGTAIVHPAGPVADRAVPKQLESLLPAQRRASSCIIEILPEGQFVTYGIGVSLMRMRNPATARARVPAGAPDGPSGSWHSRPG